MRLSKLKDLGENLTKPKNIFKTNVSKKVRTHSEIDVSEFTIQNINFDMVNEKIYIVLQPGETKNDIFLPIGEKVELVLENRSEITFRKTEERILDENKKVEVKERIHDKKIDVFDKNNRKISKVDVLSDRNIKVNSLVPGSLIKLKYFVKVESSNNYSEIMDNSRCTTEDLRTNLLNIIRKYIENNY